MMLVPYPLYPTDMMKTKQQFQFNLNSYMNTMTNVHSGPKVGLV